MEVVFFLGRLFFSVLFVWSGLDHLLHNTKFAIYAQTRGVPMPRIAVFVSGIMLLFGGLGILLGIYIRFSILLLSLFLLATLFRVHAFWREDDPAKFGLERSQFLKNLALLGALLMFLSILAPWSYSL